MRNRFIILLLIAFCPIFGASQNYNIIPNPGFEYAKLNQSPLCEYDQPIGPNSGVEQDIQYWYTRECSNWGCDYYHSAPDWMHPLCPQRNNTYLYPGNYVYLEKRGNRMQDAIGCSFISSMQDMQWYLLKIIFVKTPRKGGYSTFGDPRLKIYLTKYSQNWLASWGNLVYTITMYPPQYSSSWGWSEHWVAFTAANLSQMNSITLACENGAMYIDHVEIYPACSNPLLIEDRNFYPGQDYLPFKTNGVIVAGNDVGAPTANGDVVVHPGANLTFKGVIFDLDNSFIVEPGANFETLYEPCTILDPNLRQDSLYTFVEEINDLSENIGCGDTIYFVGLDGDTTTYKNYFWDFGNGDTLTAPTVNYVYPNGGTYLVTLILTDSLDQTDTLTKTYVVPACRLSGSQEIAEYSTEINVSPNPTSGIVNINYILNDKNYLSYTVFDPSGRIVINKTKEYFNDFQIKFKSDGVYYIKFEFEDKSIQFKKIVVAK